MDLQIRGVNFISFRTKNITLAIILCAERSFQKYLHHVLPQGEVKAEGGITFSARQHVKLSDDYRN